MITAPVTSQITPTQTTCSQFASGTASTLSSITYSLKSGKVNQVAPGVFFYWVKVPGPGTYTITQVQNGNSNLFALGAGSNVYNAACGTIGSAKITQNTTTGTVTVVSTASGTTYIGLKFSTSNVKGEPTPNPATITYTFNATQVAGSTSTVQLVKQ